ncbi:unnamed protein product [Brassicogethes aeneus]|uniref:MPN domain-containing protein n=1 Tax=Brassicogethes aeneus TaxID=1431903 RepID=A0A9P0AR51_BRAAE|nr:unnamed protein product [Brassicogethes aeneus]
MSSIKFSAKAYCKIILHAAKYPHCAINGVLLAKSTSKKEDIEFVDAVPLFHISINLTPMAEIALMQIDELVSKKGLVIAGYYTALENLKDNNFEKAHHRIVDKIAAQNGSSYVVLVNNSKLSVYLDNVALKVAQYSDGNMKPCDLHRVVLSPDTTLDTCSHLLEQEAYEELVDFDNHLDNVSLDWINIKLNEKIENIL